MSRRLHIHEQEATMSKSAGLHPLVLPALIVLGGLAAGTDGKAAGGPLACEITASGSADQITIEGVVHAEVELSGHYELKVAGKNSAGRSNTIQGGSFRASPEAPATIGRVTVGGEGTTFDVSLTVTANGMTAGCTYVLTPTLRGPERDALVKQIAVATIPPGARV
jgi:hypothetical protein